MAAQFFHLPGTTKADPSSTLLPNLRSFKIAVDTSGAVIVFDKRFWSAVHLMTDHNGVPGSQAQDVWYRPGTALPNITYGANPPSASDLASMPIQQGKDEVLQIKNAQGSNAIAFKAASGEVMVAFRANEGSYH